MGKTLPSVCLEHGTGKRMARTQASWSWFCRLRTFFTLGHMEEERLESRASCGQLRRRQGKAGRRKVSMVFRARRKFPHCLEGAGTMEPHPEPGVLGSSWGAPEKACP